MYGAPIGTRQCSFGRYHPRPPMPNPFPTLEVRNPHPKLQLKVVGKRVHMHE